MPRRPGAPISITSGSSQHGRVVAAHLHATTSATAAASRSRSAGLVHLGDAVQRALPEPGEVAREVLAAEDAVAAEGPVDLGDGLAGRREVDDELLEEACREYDLDAIDLGEASRGGVAATDDQRARAPRSLRPRAAPCRPRSRPSRGRPSSRSSRSPPHGFRTRTARRGRGRTRARPPTVSERLSSSVGYS